MQGNEAIAEAAIRAGARFFAGYPITPSTEIGEIMAGRLPQVGGRFVQMEDEIASMAAVIGASLAGVKSLTATSGPGFSLKQENLGYAIITETPCVVVEVQRMGPSTGIPTAPSQGDVMQARWGTHGDHSLIVLGPSSVVECFTETIRAFNLSERFRVPVVILIDELVGHMWEGAAIPEGMEIVERKRPSPGQEAYLPFAPGPDGVPVIANFGEGYRFHVTGLIHEESGFPTEDSEKTRRLLERLSTKLISHLDEILNWVEYDLDDAEVGIVAYGSVARAAHQAMVMAREKGIKVGLLKLLTIWPFPRDLVACLGQRMSFLVPELNMGQLVGEVERVAKRVIPLNRYDGQPMTPEEILGALEKI
jgi:2-oxoglutarate ferredoxin oxidoreductase subunit alpha